MRQKAPLWLWHQLGKQSEGLVDMRKVWGDFTTSEGKQEEKVQKVGEIAGKRQKRELSMIESKGTKQKSKTRKPNLFLLGAETREICLHS